MGMHFGLIAIPTTSKEFRDVFTDVWPKFEVKSVVEGLAGPAALSDWLQANERRVLSAQWSKDNPGVDAYGFSQFGRWAALIDTHYVLAGDLKALAALSKRFGRAVSFIVESAGGCAYFWCHEGGIPRREIISANGDVKTAGDPIEEEAGVDVSSYYMAETEALLNAFGIRPFEASVRYEALSAVDHTDYADLLKELKAKQAAARAQSSPAAKPTQDSMPADKREPAKPWWKLW